jgi:hypothetical protein
MAYGENWLPGSRDLQLAMAAVYFCIRMENSKGEAGPWGPIFWTVIP